jgi:four helix bundle protein
MGTINSFEDLKMWQMAREITKDIHLSISQNQSFQKNFSLTDQIRRSSGSIMDNIAEGFGRDGNKEFLHFLSIAKGSTNELRSQLIRAFDHDYIDKETYLSIDEKALFVTKMIIKMMLYLKKTSLKGSKFNRPD